jgi:hypothetical protein
MTTHSFIDEDIKEHISLLEKEGRDSISFIVGEKTPISIVRKNTELHKKHSQHLLSNEVTCNDVKYVVFHGLKLD